MSSDVKSPIQRMDNLVLPSENSSPIQRMDNLVLPSENSSDPPRQNLIETAVKFMQNPQVQSSAVSTRKAFLIKKGLTEKEIEIALERSGVYTSNQIAPYVAGPPPAASQQLAPYHPQGWRGYTALAVVLGSVAYCIYKFYQNVIAPLLRRRREEVEALKVMEDAVMELKSSVSETVNEVQKIVSGLKTTLDSQEQKLDQLTLDVARNKTMAASVKSIDTGEIKSELVSLKGLLLSRNQFPPTPKPSPIPAWQMASNKTNGDGDTTEITASETQPPAANQIPDDDIIREGGQKAEQTSMMVESLEESSPQQPTSQVNTPSQTVTDGQGNIARSLSGSFEGSISPSKILHSAPYQNGDVSLNGHLVSADSFNDHHDDSNKSDDSVD